MFSPTRRIRRNKGTDEVVQNNHDSILKLQGPGPTLVAPNTKQRPEEQTSVIHVMVCSQHVGNPAHFVSFLVEQIGFDLAPRRIVALVEVDRGSLFA